MENLFTAIIHKDTQKSQAISGNICKTDVEDMYVAKCPEVGTVSQGYTIEEAVKNLKEATELYLEEFSFKEQEAV